MALTHSTAAKNAILDAIDDTVNSGSGDANADFVLRDGTTELVVFALADPAFGAASSGTMALAGVPITKTASGTGTADNFLIRNKSNETVQSGTVSGIGGGGDCEIDNQSIENGQDVTLTSYVLTAPA